MKRRILLFTALCAAMLLCRLPVRAGGAYTGGYNMVLWYDYYGADNITVPQRGSFSTQRDIRFQYGDKIITEKTTNLGELPSRIDLDEGWASGKKIKLIDIPVPEGYELCFSHQPEFQIGQGMYKNQDPQEKTVDICLPIRKKGEKTDFSRTSNIVNILITVDSGPMGKLNYKYTGKQIKPPVAVYLNTIPLREGTDYTVGYGPNVEMGDGTITATGKGEFTGSRTKTFIIGPDGIVLPDSPTEPAKTGSISIGNIKYKVKANGTAAVSGLKSKKKASIKIPNTVKKNGKTYKITSINASAFKNAKATSAVIGNNVTTIGKNAFYGCKKLKKVTIGTRVKTIGKGAFYKCSKLRSIQIKSKKLTLKKTGKNAWKGIYKKARFKVPKKKIKAYRSIFRKRGAGKKIKVTK